MSRYTGPRVKKMRALGVDLPGLSRKSVERRPFPPGDHGAKRRNRKSDFGLQLAEKQKLRLNYGVSERQLRRLVVESQASKDPAGDKLIQLLERRLDNVVFRAGFAPTIPAARQLVNHRHFTVNGQRVNIPSIRVSVGDVIEVRESSKKVQVIVDSLAAGGSLRSPDWVEVEGEAMKVKISALPEGAETAPFELDIQQVIEFYSRRL